MGVIDMNGHRMYQPWYPDDFASWRAQIAQDSLAAMGNATAFEDAIRDAINTYVDQQNGWVTSSYVPGKDWTTGPFQHIQNAINNRKFASRCLGLFVCDVLIHRPEDWSIVAHHGEPGGTDYRRT